MGVNDENIPEILIVDDMDIDLSLLEIMVENMGYTCQAAANVKEAVEKLSKFMPQLILLDIVMPEMDGYQFCEMLKKNPVTKNIPVIFVSGINEYESKKKAYELGAVDFICKPYDFMELKLSVDTHIKMAKLQKKLEQNNRRLNLIISEQAIKYENEQKRVLKAIAAFSEDSKYMGMEDHISDVTHNARLLAQALNFTEKYDNQISNAFLEAIELAAAVHDLGKITISDDILNKPGKLTCEELKIVKEHTINGDKILRAAYPDVESNKFIKLASEVIRSHHENWDGSGYPDGLSREDIPLSARIIRIVDSFDSMLGERCYKKAYTEEEALQKMHEGRGSKYDPYLIDVFFKIERQLRK